MSAIVQSDPIIVWNATASVRIGFYLVTPIEQLHVDDLVAVTAPAQLERWMVERDYIGPDTPLLKYVAALPSANVGRIARSGIIRSPVPITSDQ